MTDQAGREAIVKAIVEYRDAKSRLSMAESGLIRPKNEVWRSAERICRMSEGPLPLEEWEAAAIYRDALFKLPEYQAKPSAKPKLTCKEEVVSAVNTLGPLKPQVALVCDLLIQNAESLDHLYSSLQALVGQESPAQE